VNRSRAFLQKPFTMTDLVQRVAEVSGVRPAARAAATDAVALQPSGRV